MRQVTRRIGMSMWGVLGCFVYTVCLSGVAHAVQPDQPEQPDKQSRLLPPDWDVLPNGLLIVQYDRTGDGVPDHVALHQITWSGWTGQSLDEIEAQATLDKQWVFLVEYDRDRYVYLAEKDPLFAGEIQQNGRWMVRPSSAPCSICAQ